MAITEDIRTNSPDLDRETSKARLQDLKFLVHRQLLDRINLEAVSALPLDRVRQEVRPSVAKILSEDKTPLSLVEKDRLIEEVLDEVFGLGPLEPLLKDRSVSDILVTTNRLVYVERAGKLQRTAVEFKDNSHLQRIIERVVSRVGRRIDESSPMVDARLPDGSRVNAVIPPLAVDGPLLSIRRFSKDPLRPSDLTNKLALTPGMLDFLESCVKSRLNVIISGGTGAGKTTFLNVLSGFIAEDERIVTIEDAAELQMRQTHVARLETRPANLEGRGAITQRHLLINALRMRPDRIVVGEVRGEEALDMLQAMNTGHDGSLTTVHANSPRDAISRLEVMVGMYSGNLNQRSIRQQIASAVDLFIQIARLSDGSRRVTHITECIGMEGDQVTTQDIFLFERTGVSSDGRVLGRFRATGVRPKVSDRLKAAGIELPGSLFQSSTEVR
ncbi:CpaF family protein [Nevskia soli]|jgi:pilus assembly protein CpaF|uniref:CpaF family protein n=1 Tax=Nevskia soli TaxID=418856 RepID=UPI0015D6ECEF|nr:CpaF family protein [Nevskia soli]